MSGSLEVDDGKESLRASLERALEALRVATNAHEHVVSHKLIEAQRVYNQAQEAHYQQQEQAATQENDVVASVQHDVNTLRLREVKFLVSESVVLIIFHFFLLAQHVVSAMHKYMADSEAEALREEATVKGLLDGVQLHLSSFFASSSAAHESQSGVQDVWQQIKGDLQFCASPHLYLFFCV